MSPPANFFRSLAARLARPAAVASALQEPPIRFVQNWSDSNHEIAAIGIVAPNFARIVNCFSFLELNGFYFRQLALQKDQLPRKHPSNRCGTGHACVRTQCLRIHHNHCNHNRQCACTRSSARSPRRPRIDHTQVQADNRVVVQKCSRPPRRPRSCGCGRWSTSTTSSAPSTSASGSKPIVDIVRMSQMLSGA